MRTDETVYPVHMPTLKDVMGQAAQNFPAGYQWPDRTVVREVRFRGYPKIVADGKPHLFSYAGRVLEISLTDWRRVS